MSMFKLIAVTDQASCPENFWTQLQLLAASEIDALIFRAKELPPQEYYRQASQVQKICRTHQLPLILPDLTDYSPSKSGASPLEKAQDWVQVEAISSSCASLSCGHRYNAWAFPSTMLTKRYVPLTWAPIIY